LHHFGEAARAAMDESAFRHARSAVAPLRCVFEKALLARCAGCDVAARHALAEREAVACTSPVARTNCATLLALLRERSAFALRVAPGDSPLPHAAMMKLQCGGLRGLRRAVAADRDDVHGLVAAARQRFGSLVDLPWADIVPAVVAWQGRRRHRGADQ
jgi:hypothetical protein